MVVHGSRGFGKVNFAVGFFNFCGVGGLGAVLLDRRDRSGNDFLDRFHQQRRAGFTHFIVDRFKIVVFLNRYAGLQEHFAGVQPRVHQHGGNAGFLLPFQNSPLHGRRAAVFGQERPVHVHAAVFGIIEQRFGQNLAVRRYHDQVGVDFGQRFVKRSVFQSFRLINGNAALLRENFDRWRRQHIAAPFGLVGLGDHAHHIHARLDQRAQRKKSKLRRSHKQNAHGGILLSNQRICKSFKNHSKRGSSPGKDARYRRRISSTGRPTTV